MKIKISHILQILSPNILFLRKDLHLTVHRLFVVSGENSYVSGFPVTRIQAGERKCPLYVCFSPNCHGLLQTLSFQLKVKPLNGNFKIWIKCDWHSVICTKFPKSLTQCLWETWTVLELHKEIIEMTNTIINVLILLIIYLLNTYKNHTETIIFLIPESLDCIISFDEWIELETHAIFQWVKCKRIEWNVVGLRVKLCI